MYNQIKKLADEAIALQNKDRMDAVLREISARCERVMQAEGNNFELAPLADIGTPQFDPATQDVELVEKLAAANPGDFVQITGIKNMETGAVNVKVTQPVKPTKKGGAK